MKHCLRTPPLRSQHRRLTCNNWLPASSPDEQRISFWPQHFGLIPQWVTLEPRIFGWMDRLCENYCGGIWNLYTPEQRRGIYGHPEPGTDVMAKTGVLFNAHER